MSRLIRHRLLAYSALAFFIPGALGGQSPWEPDNGHVTGIVLTHDNDLFYELGTRRQNYDRNYTGALSLTVFGDWVYSSRLDRPLRWLDRQTRITALRDSTRLHFYSASALISAFTPDSLNTPDPLPNDRPYASLTGVAVRRMSVDPAGYRSAWTTELVVGVLGLDYARRAQSFIHHVLRDPPAEPQPYIPEGWGNQISNGGELTALYRVGYSRFLFGDAPTPGAIKHWQASGGWSGSLGYYTTATADFSIRAGRFRSEFWEHLPGVLSNANQSLGRNGHRGRTVEAFLHASVRPRLTLYNALLQGQFRESAVTVAGSDVRRVVGEAEFGGVLFVPIRNGGMQLSWSPLVMRTRDASTVDYSVHRWGSASVTVSLGLAEP